MVLAASASKTVTGKKSAAKKSAPAVHRIIEGETDIKDGIRALRRLCPHMKKAHDLIGDPPLRRNEGGFPGLARIIVGQQLSVLAARAIWTRLDAHVKPMTAERLLAESDEALRACGLSRGKIKTLRAIAEAVVAGLDLDNIATIEEQHARDQLTAVSGIGPWTADIYLMFCIGRADIFAPGDLALQIAAQMAMGLDSRPSIKDMTAIAERWSPWRGVAARLLWHYYAHAKAQKNLTPV